MSPVAGPFFAAAVVLAVAGIAKVARPDPTRVALRTVGLPSGRWTPRLVGVVELAVAAFALVVGGRLAAGLLALAYAAFAGFSYAVIRGSSGRASCGCFGASGAPLTTLHVGVDLAIATLGVVALLDPVPGIATVAADTPLAGVPLVGFVLLLAWLVQVLLTVLPELQSASRPPAKVAR